MNINNSIIILLKIIIFFFFQKSLLFPKEKINYNQSKKQLDFGYFHKFVILQLKNPICGLFCFYINYLGCINQYINLGFIPIIDLQSFPNVFN